MSGEDRRERSSGLARLVPAAVAGWALAQTVVGAGSRRSPDPPPENGEPLPDPEQESGLKRLILRLDRLQRRVTPLAFVYGVVKKFGDDRAGRLAALVAYYGFFSLFPLLLVLVTVLGFVLEGNPDWRADIEASAVEQFPVIGDQLPTEATTPLAGSGLALVVGVAVALWAGLGAMQAAQDAMNTVYSIPRAEYPNFAKKRLKSLLTLLTLGAMLLGSAALSQFVRQVPDVLGAARALLVVGTVLVISLVFLVAFQVLTAQRQPWARLLPGALLAGVAYYVLQQIGAWYVNRTVTGAEDTYGTFAVVIGLLGWLYLQAQLTIISAEVNVVAARRLWPRSLLPEHLTEADRTVLTATATSQRILPHQEIQVGFTDPSATPR